MDLASETPAIMEFGHFRIVPHRRELLADNRSIQLGGRTCDVLMALIEGQGAVVAKDALMGRVWPNRIVEESSLHVQISALRNAFGAHRDLIRTISGRGYQFTGEIRTIAASPNTQAVAGTAVSVSAPRRPPTNLPEPVSELIGRDVEFEEILGLTAAHRLVTLTGAGGIGKTRLGLEVARRLLPKFPDGVWAIELAPLSDPDLVPATVATALGLDLADIVVSPERIANALAAKQLLLVLDNCEHLVGAAASMAEALLRANPAARVMATSREPLRAEGECLCRVPSLAVPTEGSQDAEDPMRYGAVRLFVARARAAAPQFSPEGRVAAAIAAICRHLDGIPLAIELAAARTNALGVEELAARLDDCFHLLTGGRRTALPRHQTLRATLDWSYRLLPEPERVVLRRLAVFAGDFTAEAASLVTADDEIAVSDVVCSLANLVTKSLVTLEAGGAIAHHRLHETTRVYALEKLAESGEFDQVARRHANYYRDLFDKAEIELDALPAPTWLTRYGRQIGQVRAALDWAFSPTGAAEVGVALTVAAVPLWVHLSLMEECRGRVEQALSGPTDGRDARRDMQLYAALGAALFLTKGSCPEMVAAFARALEIAEGLDDTDYRLRALWGSFMEHITSLRYRAALAVAEKFCTFAAKSTDPADGLVGDRLVGVALLALGDLEGARRHIERMLGRYVAKTSHIIRYQFDQQLLAYSYRCRILWLQGFADQALASVESHLVAARASDHPYSLFSGLLQTACPLALLVGDLTLAERYIKALMDLSARHAVELWTLGGRCYGGVLLIKRGSVGAGLELLRTAFARIPQGAFTLFYTPMLD